MFSLNRLRSLAATTLAVAACAGTISYPSSAGSRSLQVQAAKADMKLASPQRSTAGKPRRYEEFQVAAGTALPIELRTHLSSGTSRAGDEVEGRLQRAIVADDVELVPAGATVLGTVTEAEPARPRSPARLSLTFSVIQHPETGSRAMIRSSVLTFRSEMPQRGMAFLDVELAKRMDATVTLLAPLLVRIPIGTTVR